MKDLIEEIKNEIYEVKRSEKNFDREDVVNYLNNIESRIDSEYYFMESSSKLLNSLIEGKSLKYIINLGSEILKNPVILVDSGYKVLAHSKKEDIDEIFWKENIKKGYCSLNFINEVKKIKEVKEAPKSNTPFIVTCPESPVRKMVSKVIINGKSVGNLIALEKNGIFDDNGKNLLKTLSMVISEELQKNKIFKNFSGVMYENLLYDLLEDNIEDIRTLEERTESCGIKNNEIYSAFYFDLSVYTDRYFNIVYNTLTDCFQNYKNIFYKNGFLVLTENENVLSECKDILKKYNIKCGISDKFSNLMELKKYFIQAKKSAYYIREDKNTMVSYYNDFKTAEFIKSAALNICSDDYINNMISEVEIFDKKNNTEYLYTLKKYFENNCNLLKTSEKLFIHRNSLAYRLGKIKEITNYNLDDGEKNFNLYFSIKLKEINRFIF